MPDFVSLVFGFQVAGIFPELNLVLFWQYSADVLPRGK